MRATEEGEEPGRAQIAQLLNSTYIPSLELEAVALRTPPGGQVQPRVICIRGETY